MALAKKTAKKTAKGLSTKQKKEIRSLIREMLKKKIENYKPSIKLDNHLLLAAIVPKDARRRYSAIHSLLTAFGMSVFEQIAVIIVRNNSSIAKRQWKSEIKISSDRKKKIDEIITKISNEEKLPDMDSEIKEILSIPNNNLVEQKDGQIVDVYFKRGKKEYYIDIKTVGPNKAGFLDHKRMTLTWVARANKKIHPAIAFPYNRDHPKPYKKVGSNVMQVGVDLLVGKDFWDLLGGKGCYEDLSKIFKKTGEWYWTELEKKF
jgi:hypothetical protein